MKKTAVVLMLITIVSKVFGFARDISLSYFYGASDVSDAYLISITIPIVIFGFIGTGIFTGYIPIYSNIETKAGTVEGYKYTSNLINIILVICTGVLILGLIFTNTLVKFFASGFEGNTLFITVQFTRITLIGIYFSAITYIFTGFLQIKENYIIPALIGFPMNLIIIFSIFISSKTNVIYLAIGSVLATASQLVLLWPFIVKKGYKHRLTFNLRDENIKNMAYLAIPAIIGVSVNQINVLVDKTIASQLAVGGISALNYANRLNGFVQGLFVTTIATVLYPTISQMAAQKNMKELKKSVSEAINIINLLVIPTTIGAMVFAEPVVKLLFGRGAFDAKSAAMTSYALFFYSAGMIGVGLREVLSRVFYSLKETKIPMFNAGIAMVMNIILNVLLSRVMGIGGLALATSISAVFCTILLFINLRKKIGPFGLKQIGISFLKILFASIIMGGVAKLSFDYLADHLFSQNVSLLLAIGIGAFLYFAIIYFMGIEDVNIIINSIKRRIGVRVK